MVHLWLFSQLLGLNESFISSTDSHHTSMNKKGVDKYAEYLFLCYSTAVPNTYDINPIPFPHVLITKCIFSKNEVSIGCIVVWLL